jgi:hypothetical protein
MHSSRLGSLALLFGALASGGCDGSPPAMDAGMEDAGAPECERNGDCDDGDYCNGAEVCRSGSCLEGMAIDCDDDNACTVDSCDEDDDACVNDPLDSDGDGHVGADCGGDDCDDADPERFPENAEICDAEGHDEDCDPATFGERDRDGDDAFDDGCCNGTTCGDDCDDNRESVNLGAVEACDGVDNNCDGIVDEGVSVMGYVDEDGDLHGDVNRPISACAGTPGFSSIGDDCDDADRTRHGGQAEICDGIDNDCDGSADEDAREVSWYVDDDGDGFGDPSNDVVRSCAPVTGRSLLGTDCNDANASVHPAAAERCNGTDDNCNGLADYRIDSGDFEDDDGDGLLDAQCTGGMDCDDTNPEIAGGFPEICDGRDNDCDAEIDEETSPVVWFADLDQDGYGSSSSGAVVSCTAVAGHSLRGGDCDDRSADRRPYAIETCDGLDEDCDSAIDESVSRACSSSVGICVEGRQACVSGTWSMCTGTSGTNETCNGIDDDCDGTPDDGLSCP